jgi:hypothetical protein
MALLECVLLAALVSPVGASTGRFTAFGPREYVRARGRPTVVRDTFSVHQPDTAYSLLVYDGGRRSRVRRERAARAVITLNGVDVVVPRDFDRRGPLIVRRVALTVVNRLVVRILGDPGSRITITVVGVDRDPPTITAVASPPPNAAGWNATDVTVSFECEDACSGIRSCPKPVTVASEGAHQVVSGTAVDRAGNTASVSVTLSVDKSAPTIAAHVDPPPNAAGWSHSDSTVSFACADGVSGIASCPEPVLITSEGLGQAVSGAATDWAGHSLGITVVVNMDKTPPELSLSEGGQGGEPALEIRYVRAFELVWNDGGSGAQQDGSFYRPIPPADYFVLGDYGQGDYAAPDGTVAVVKELVQGALAVPAGYEQIWNDSGSGAHWDGAFWKPVPPDGYTCLGVVVTRGYAAPAPDAVRCVDSTLVAPAKVWLPIWNDEASGANRDVGTWAVAPWNEDGVHLGLMTAQGYGQNGGYAPPTSDLWVLDRRKVRGAEFPLNARALEVLYVGDFELAWHDGGSGADRDGAFYRPVPPPGFSVIGYYGQGDYGPPNGLAAVVKALLPGALTPPVRYEQIWNDSGSGADMDGAFWRPIPPDGYTCLGAVVTAGYAWPPLDAVRCVRTELTAPASIDRSLWDDRGSGADRDLAVWHLVPNAVGGVYLGTFTGGGTYDAAPEKSFFVLREAATTTEGWVAGSAARFQGVASDALSGLDTVTCNGMPAPLSDGAFVCDVSLSGHASVAITATDVAGNSIVVCRTTTTVAEALDVSYATSFTPVWDDSGSGAVYDGAFYRPVPVAAGFVALGHYGQGDYGAPIGVLLMARERTSGALAPPVGYELIWIDAGSGATDDGGFWWPLPPPGYRCLGMVATRGWSLPSRDEVRCVRSQLVAPGYVGSEIWNDDGSLAHRDFGSWQIAPRGGSGLHTGAFTGRSYPSDQGYAKPTLPVYVLDARAVAGSPPLTEEEVAGVIAHSAPVLRLHANEQYLPDDPERVLEGATLQWALVRNEGAYCWPPEMCGSEGQYSEHLGEMPTSAATLMADVALIEGYRSAPPYDDDPDFRTWLSIPDALKHGQLDRARPVVHVRPRGPFTEIQFWYFYAFNGPGRIRICWEHCEYEQFDQAGRHYGDWEMVSLLVDNDTQAVLAAGLSRHGNVEWSQYAQLERHTDGVRPLVYAALNSHANYRHAGEHYHEVVFHAGPIKAMTYDLTNAGLPFVTQDYHRAREEPTLSPEWLQFPYRWGQYIWNHDDVYFLSTNYYDQNEVNPGPTGPARKPEW